MKQKPEQLVEKLLSEEHPISHKYFSNKDESPASPEQVRSASHASATWGDADWRVFGRILGIVHDEDDEDDITTEDIRVAFDFATDLTKGIYSALEAERLVGPGPTA